MPLSKNILGTSRYNAQLPFSNKTADELIAAHGSLEGARVAALIADSEAIINHFVTYGVIAVNVITTGTATAHTGTGTGTIV